MPVLLKSGGEVINCNVSSPQKRSLDQESSTTNLENDLQLASPDPSVPKRKKLSLSLRKPKVLNEVPVNSSSSTNICETKKNNDTEELDQILAWYRLIYERQYTSTFGLTQKKDKDHLATSPIDTESLTKADFIESKKASAPVSPTLAACIETHVSPAVTVVECASEVARDPFPTEHLTPTCVESVVVIKRSQQTAPNNLDIDSSKATPVSEGEFGIINPTLASCTLAPAAQKHPNKKSGIKYKPKIKRWPTRRSRRLVGLVKKKMLNGYGGGNGRKSSTDDSPSSDLHNFTPIATLSNLGNTCFLNSVLYTLRFAPSFVHNLHHLTYNLAKMNKPTLSKSKTSSLGRNIQATKSWSTKDLICLPTPPVVDFPKCKLQVTTEMLHALFESLHSSEMKESCVPFPADDYLRSLRDVNPYFDGNQQHDAHELLVCLLNNVHESCALLSKYEDQAQSELTYDTKDSYLSGTSMPPLTVLPVINTKSWGVRKSWKKKKEKPVDADALEIKLADTEAVESVSELAKRLPLISIEDSHSSMISRESCSIPTKTDSRVNSFVVDDFQGVTILNTTCLECERSSLRKEVFSDICVPIVTERRDDDDLSDDSDCAKTPDELYESAIVTSEYLRDSNKYWCESCTRYNEAKRSVQYERLPKLLTLQLKRFASHVNSMTKVNDYMPTPQTLACFCMECQSLPDGKKLHSYTLFAVIMHLGQTIASGHYVAYVRASNDSSYLNCEQEKSVTSTSGSKANVEKVSGFFRFFKPKTPDKSQTTSTSPSSYACGGIDCCSVKLSKSLADNATCGTLGTKQPAAESSQNGIWFECDDDNVRPLSLKEFEDILAPRSAKHSGQTPYLLFYARD